MDYMFANDEECSSGCESGWTLYLDHSSISSYDRRNDHSRRRRVISRDDEKILKEEDEEEEEEEEEGLSMVSDASSGPPHHVHESEDGNDDALLMSRNRKKNRDKRRRNSMKVQDRDPLLDDTASSPLFDFSNKSSTLTTNKTSTMENNVLEYSQGYSTTQFEQVRPPYQQHCHDFFQPGNLNQLQQQNQW